MTRRINEDIFNIVINGGRAKRTYICENSLLYFALYYFSEYFEYALAEYHYDFFDDFQALIEGRVPSVGWIAYRESAKTTIVKIGIAWVISYRKKRFINYDSYDLGNSEAALLDIIVWLQTNRKIINDFGQLYYKPKKKENENQESTQKRVGSFITNNKIKVEAYSTQEPTRGRLFQRFRPDLYIFDDVENAITIRSRAVTQKIIDHINEAITGLSVDGGFILLGNRITDEGVVSSVVEQIKRGGGIVRDIKIIMDGKPAWPDKYAMTDKEAYERNKYIENPNQFVVSIEEKRRKHATTFETEFMNNPGKSGDYYFSRHIVETLFAKARDPIKDVAGFKMWDDFQADRRYGLGGDTAEGTGLDSNASAVIDFSATPNRVVGTYANNMIPPHTFAHELARQGRLFGECFCIPEINNTGYATVAELVSPTGCDYQNVYQRVVKNKVSGQLSQDFGWRTTVSTKADLFSHLKSAIESGELEVYDIELLEEIKHFKKIDSINISRDTVGGTRHFDKLMALALAWEARKYASSLEDKESMFKGLKREPYKV